MEEIILQIKNLQLDNLHIMLIMTIVFLLQEILLWGITHDFMGKKCGYDCEKCNDWSCQKSYCDYKRKELENKKRC